MKGVNLTNAIAALRARIRARRSGDADLFTQAELDVKAQQPYCAQVQQALIQNGDNMTLSTVTAGWVKARMREKGASS